MQVYPHAYMYACLHTTYLLPTYLATYLPTMAYIQTQQVSLFAIFTQTKRKRDHER